MRVLVCGGRTFGNLPNDIEPGALPQLQAKARDERDLVSSTLTRLHQLHHFTVLIQGGQRGADYWAKKWAERHGVPVLEFKANWYPNGRRHGVDRSAGPRRNAKMIAEGKPDRVIAFPGGKGTASMLAIARAAGAEIQRIPTNEATEVA